MAPRPTYYEQCKARGECPRCRAPARPGHVHCDTHLHAMRQWTQAYREARSEAARMMAHCGRWHPLGLPPWHCPDCGDTLLYAGAEDRRSV